nr:uncharacterized protein [Tanacetum cinerariifolium]
EKGYVFVEIVKLCDAMLERVLKEVKLEIFETGFWKKASLLVWGSLMYEKKTKKKVVGFKGLHEVTDAQKGYSEWNLHGEGSTTSSSGLNNEQEKIFDHDIDGFNPFKTMNVAHSIWLVVLIPYNLPPWLVMKQPNFIFSLIIPGLGGPRNKIDVYMKPLIKELLELWKDGIETFDASVKQNFMLRAAIHSMIFDFPGYENGVTCGIEDGFRLTIDGVVTLDPL